MSEKRSIFEEVDTSNASSKKIKNNVEIINSNKSLQIWLLVLFALVAAMIVVGGLTRLTDSGLSITEWKPLTGALPPLSLEIWQLEFDKYKTIPEFTIQNKAMTLSCLLYTSPSPRD